MDKYKGIYRLRCEVDQSTNDFPRKLNGTYEDIDIYIDCSYGNKIFHNYRKILEAYIPSLQRGHNIIKQIYATYINPENAKIVTSGNDIIRTSYQIKDKELYDEDMSKTDFIFNITETDSEVLFQFNDSNSEYIIPLLKPKTSVADRSPFSTKNLPKRDYEIPVEDMREYTDIIKPIKEDDNLLALSQMTRNFMSGLSKKRQYKSIDMKTYMRKKMLKGKEFIHSEGLWDEYLKFLKKEIEKYDKSKKVTTE